MRAGVGSGVGMGVAVGSAVGMGVAVGSAVRPNVDRSPPLQAASKAIAMKHSSPVDTTQERFFAS